MNKYRKQVAEDYLKETFINEDETLKSFLEEIDYKEIVDEVVSDKKLPLKTYRNFVTHESDDRDNGIYDDFSFSVNLQDHRILLAEITNFDNKLDYSLGLFNRVTVMLNADPSVSSNINDMKLKSLIYLNPNVPLETLIVFLKNYSNSFNSKNQRTFNLNDKISTLKTIYYNHVTYNPIKRKDCYKSRTRFIVNELKLAQKYNTNIYKKDFREIKKTYLPKDKMLYEWKRSEVYYFIMDNLHNPYLNENLIMNTFLIMDVDILNEYLEYHGVKFNWDKLELTIKDDVYKLDLPCKKIIELQLKDLFRNKKSVKKKDLSELRYVIEEPNGEMIDKVVGEDIVNKFFEYYPTWKKEIRDHNNMVRGGFFIDDDEIEEEQVDLYNDNYIKQHKDDEFLLDEEDDFFN